MIENSLYKIWFKRTLTCFKLYCPNKNQSLYEFYAEVFENRCEIFLNFWITKENLSARSKFVEIHKMDLTNTTLKIRKNVRVPSVSLWNSVFCYLYIPIVVEYNTWCKCMANKTSLLSLYKHLGTNCRVILNYISIGKRWKKNMYYVYYIKYVDVNECPIWRLSPLKYRYD